MTDRIPCKKCLLQELAAEDQNQVYQRIRQLIDLMPEGEKANEATYQGRLAICKECEELLDATCLQCGCYVELRAAKKKERCPKRRWA